MSRCAHILPTICPQLQTSPVITSDELPLLEGDFGVSRCTVRTVQSWQKARGLLGAEAARTDELPADLCHGSVRSPNDARPGGGESRVGDHAPHPGVCAGLLSAPRRA